MALVSVWSKKRREWLEYSMLVDSGADYTLFPRYVADELGIDLEKETKKCESRGVGGGAVVYFLKKGLKIKIGNLEIKTPTGFLSGGDIPPLLGREECLNLFDLRFHKFKTTFRA